MGGEEKARKMVVTEDVFDGDDGEGREEVEVEGTNLSPCRRSKRIGECRKACWYQTICR